MREIRFIWVCRNIQFNEIHRVELTDIMLLDGSYPSWIKTDNCEIIAKILPTGLHDKNGKEIYEGDIVREDKELWKIVWEVDKLAGFEAVNIHREHISLGGAGWERCEVTGNIYENPELLNSRS